MPGRRERTLWRGGIPRRFGDGPSRVGLRLRRENEALKARAVAGPLRRVGDGENATRAEVPRGTPPRRGQASKGEAHGRSGASRAGRDGGGSRDGGDQTSDVARGGSGEPAVHNGSAAPRPCRRARKLRRGSIGRRPPGSESPVRGCSDQPLKGRASARRAANGFGRSHPHEREPAGRPNAARVGRNPMPS